MTGYVVEIWNCTQKYKLEIESKEDLESMDVILDIVRKKLSSQNAEEVKDAI